MLQCHNSDNDLFEQSLWFETELLNNDFKNKITHYIGTISVIGWLGVKKIF